MTIRILFILASLLLAAPAQVKDFTLPSARGGDGVIRLSDHAGKVVLVNFWRTSCPACDREVVQLRELYQRLKPNGLEIIGVADESSASVGKVARYLAAKQVTWPVGLNDMGEFHREIRSRGSGATPGNWVISRSGKLEWLGLDRGPAAWRKLVDRVEALIDEPAPSRPAITPRATLELPKLRLATPGGGTFALASLRGRPAIVNVFTPATAGWAGKVLAELHRSGKPSGLQVVGICLNGTKDVISTARKETGASYPILQGDNSAIRAFEGRGWLVLFVDAKGRIVKRIWHSRQGGIEATVFAAWARSLLSG